MVEEGRRLHSRLAGRSLDVIILVFAVVTVYWIIQLQFWYNRARFGSLRSNKLPGKLNGDYWPGEMGLFEMVAILAIIATIWLVFY